MAKPMTPIDNHWVSYLEKVMNPKAGFAQVRDTKRAFYAGAFATFEIMVNVGDMSEKDAIVAMDSLCDRFAKFMADIDGGTE